VAFPGCAVIAAHDRWFLDRVATHILAWEGTPADPARWYWFDGNFAGYERSRLTRLGADANRTPRAAHRRLSHD
jgi:ATPase subunit of ABC transporter with duplicated ATPase domains